MRCVSAYPVPKPDPLAISPRQMESAINYAIQVKVYNQFDLAVPKTIAVTSYDLRA